MDEKKRPKITVIGAASTGFSNTLGDIISDPVFQGAEIALVDVDEPNLEAVVRVGQRMADELKNGTVVSGSPRCEDVLAGSDFVISTIAVGGVKAWQQDEDIPQKYGYYGCSVDTVGPGGLFRGLRLIPALMDICRTMERVCPDALLINYSNPMTAVCRAVNKVSTIRTVGLCTAGNQDRSVARKMEIDDQSRVEALSGGVNHCVWLRGLKIDGKDALADFLETRREDTTTYNLASRELLEAFGAWPMPGTNHVAEFFPYFFGDPNDAEARAKYPFQREHDFKDRLAKDEELRAKLHRQAEGKEPLGSPNEAVESASEAVRLMASVWENKAGRYFVNVPNEGAIDDLPEEAVVEIPAKVDGSGVDRVRVGKLPHGVIGLVQARSHFFDLLADAAINQSKDLALQCLLADTNTTSLHKARACVDEMFEVQKAWLEGFE